MQKQIVDLVVYDPKNKSRHLMTHTIEAVIYRRGDDVLKKSTSAYYEPVGMYYVRRGPFWLRVKLTGSRFLLELTLRNFVRAFFPNYTVEQFLNVCKSQRSNREAPQQQAEGTTRKAEA